MTYQSTLFPDPAVKAEAISDTDYVKCDDRHTFPVYPREGAQRFPFLVDGTLSEPDGRPTVMGFTCNIEIC
jgi:hypothetical protein